MDAREHLLDICLAQLNTGDADLASVLAQYPEQAAELEPMLRAALAVRRAPLPEPRSAARQMGRERLVDALVARLPAEALDSLLTALHDGIDLDALLVDHPYRAQLEPLVCLAQAVSEVPQPTARAEARAAGYARLLTAVERRRRYISLLDRSLEQLAAGRPIESIVAAAGEHAPALETALRTAGAVTAVPHPAPSAQHKALGLARLQHTAELHRHLDPILDRALCDLEAGVPLQQILARYPLHAQTLEPLLKAAGAVRQTPTPVARPEAKAVGLERLLEAAAHQRRLEDIVDAAVADIRAARADLPMLLARHREHAEALEPMLLAALTAATTPAVEARPRARAEGRTRLMAEVAAKRAAVIAEKLDVAVAHWRAGVAVEAILAAEPHYRAELEPLLHTAIAVEHTPDPVSDAHLRTEGQRRLIRAARSRRQSQPGTVWAPLQTLLTAFSAPRGAFRQAFIAAMALLLFVTSTLVGVTRAAANSLPDDALYPVKLATEQIQIVLAPSPAARAQLQVAFVQERLREVQAATAAGRDPQRAVQEFARQKESAQELLTQLPSDQQEHYRQQLQVVARQETVVLGGVKPVAPAAQVPAERPIDTATPAPIVHAIVPTATPNRPIPTATEPSQAPSASPAPVVVAPSLTPASGSNSGSSSGASVVAPPVKALLVPTAEPVQHAPAVPTAQPPSLAPTAAPSIASPVPPTTDTPVPVVPSPIAPVAPRQVIQPSSGRSTNATATPVPSNTPEPVTGATATAPAAAPTTSIVTVEPTATSTPKPAPTVVAPATRQVIIGPPTVTATPKPSATSQPAQPTPTASPRPAATSTPLPPATATPASTTTAPTGTPGARPAASGATPVPNTTSAPAATPHS